MLGGAIKAVRCGACNLPSTTHHHHNAIDPSTFLPYPLLGFVEIKVNGTWGAICGCSRSGPQYEGWWTTADAQVACRQLGLPWAGASAFTGTVPHSSYNVAAGITGPGSARALPFLAGEVQCNGNEAHISECPLYTGTWPAEQPDCNGCDAGEAIYMYVCQPSACSHHLIGVGWSMHPLGP